jgi:hypothetical protein
MLYLTRTSCKQKGPEGEPENRKFIENEIRILSGGNEHGKSKTTLGLTGYRLLSYHLAGGRGRIPL